MELRWLEIVDYMRDGSKVRTKVLQVRYQEGPPGETWGGEWEDIPTVVEDNGY